MSARQAAEDLRKLVLPHHLGGHSVAGAAIRAAIEEMATLAEMEESLEYAGLAKQWRASGYNSSNFALIVSALCRADVEVMRLRFERDEARAIATRLLKSHREGRADYDEIMSWQTGGSPRVEEKP